MIADWVAGFPPYLQGAVNHILELWYTYRSSVLLAVFFLLLLVRIYFHTPDENGTLVMLPSLYREEDRPAGGTETEGTRRGVLEKAGVDELEGRRGSDRTE